MPEVTPGCFRRPKHFSRHKQVLGKDPVVLGVLASNFPVSSPQTDRIDKLQAKTPEVTPPEVTPPEVTLIFYLYLPTSKLSIVRR